MPRQMDCTASGKGNEKKDGMGSSKVVVTTTMKMGSPAGSARSVVSKERNDL